MRVWYFIFLLLLAGNLFGYDSVAVNDMTYMREDAPSNNYGSNTTAEQYSYSVAVSRNVLLRFDAGSITVPEDSIFFACTLWVFCNSVVTGTPDPQYYQCLRAWTEAGATWTNYNGIVGWSVGGGEGSGTDRGTSALGSFSLTSASWIAIELDSALVDGWISGSITNNGILFWDSAPNSWAATYSTDDGANKPYVRIYYAEAPVTSQVIITE